jgi:hypothetical protein
VQRAAGVERDRRAVVVQVQVQGDGRGDAGLAFGRLAAHVTVAGIYATRQERAPERPFESRVVAQARLARTHADGDVAGRRQPQRPADALQLVEEHREAAGRHALRQEDPQRLRDAQAQQRRVDGVERRLEGDGAGARVDRGDLGQARDLLRHQRLEPRRAGGQEAVAAKPHVAFDGAQAGGGRGRRVGHLPPSYGAGAGAPAIAGAHTRPWPRDAHTRRRVSGGAGAPAAVGAHTRGNLRAARARTARAPEAR